ncbi:hypothetical protein [Mycolicibacterium sp. A43C]
MTVGPLHRIIAAQASVHIVDAVRDTLIVVVEVNGWTLAGGRLNHHLSLFLLQTPGAAGGRQCLMSALLTATPLGRTLRGVGTTPINDVTRR